MVEFVPATREIYDPDCVHCPRLAGFLKEVRKEHPDYWARPVGPFGAKQPHLLLVGLAPGMHGANRTGRPFTGDYAGILLYETLHELGLATRPTSVSADDPLKLIDTRITNSVKCVPPQNKPVPAEIKRCNVYLKNELAALKPVRAIVALGRIAHEAVLMALELKRGPYPFAHGREHALPDGRTLIDSYHCSRYNTQTRRLTAAMFKKVIGRAKELASD
jgi:uracil-DNA glycosylase